VGFFFLSGLNLVRGCVSFSFPKIVSLTDSSPNSSAAFSHNPSPICPPLRIRAGGMWLLTHMGTFFWIDIASGLCESQSSVLPFKCFYIFCLVESPETPAFCPVPRMIGAFLCPAQCHFLPSFFLPPVSFSILGVRGFHTRYSCIQNRPCFCLQLTGSLH